MKKLLILSVMLGSSVVLLPSIDARAATVSAFKAEPQIIIQTRRNRRTYRSYDRRYNRRWNERRNQRSYWGWRNRYYNRGRVVNRSRISRYGFPTIYQNRTRVRRNWRNY